MYGHMLSRLHRINNWYEFAERSGYSARKLAKTQRRVATPAYEVSSGLSQGFVTRVSLNLICQHRQRIMVQVFRTLRFLLGVQYAKDSNRLPFAFQVHFSNR
jgi:hypothetical protein